MDFVVDNYLWFIIGGIVVLMIIIGYFAEKTNFGKQPLRKKKSENVEKEIDEQATQDVSEVEASVSLEEKGINDILEQTNNEYIEDSISEEQVGLDEVIVDEPQQVQELPEVTFPEEDLNVPFGEEEAETKKKKKNNKEEETPVLEESEDNEDDVWKF